jgi:hypothetical protein
VLALDQDTVPVDQPHVGLVGQQLGDAAEAERLGRIVAAAAVPQPTGGQLGGEPLQGPVAAGVQLERGQDVVGAVGVGFDAGHQPPPDRLAGVAVTQGGLVGPAALLGLLGHALADLGGQIGRVELGHQGVDALGEAALGAVLQGLDHADQLDPEAPEQGPDGDVVLEVAGEPIDLVHHHLDVWLLSGGRRRGASGADRSGARCGARHPARSYLCLRKAVNTVVPAQSVQSDL